jgi:ribose-phosphate pyrophosphokinase
MENGRRMLVFAGTHNRALSEEIASELGTELGDVRLERFANGEIYVRYNESVRGAHTFCIQPICYPVNAAIMELLIMLDAAKRASAGTITAVIPHYGYARQDRKSAAREPITAKLVADLLTTAGADRVITMDLHQGQIQGFFDQPVNHLTALPILAEYIRELDLENPVVVSPDVGRVKANKRFADMVDATLAILHKGRPQHNVAEITHLIGEADGRDCVILDDMIDTAGSVTEGARALKAKGAKRVLVAATHGLFSGPALDRLEEAPIEEVIVTNTMPMPEGAERARIRQLSVASLFARAIRNVFEDESVSSLFDPDFEL